MRSDHCHALKGHSTTGKPHHVQWPERTDIVFLFRPEGEQELLVLLYGEEPEMRDYQKDRDFERPGTRP